MTISRKILHMFPTRHPTKQGAECELFCPLYFYFPLISLAGDVTYWATLLWCKGCLFFGNSPFISLPFLFSLVCCSNLKFSGWLLSFSRETCIFLIRSGGVIQNSWAPCLMSCLAWASPQPREFTFLKFKRPLILILLHVELSVPLWHLRSGWVFPTRTICSHVASGGRNNMIFPFQNQSKTVSQIHFS